MDEKQQEKLRNENIQPVKLTQKPKMTPHVTRIHGEKPEYELVEPSFRYLANIEENYLHLREAEAKKRFCKRFLKAREIELKKQKKREERIEKARQKCLRQEEPTKKDQTPLHWNITRDYVKYNPLFRYIENVKLNYYDYLTPRQKTQIDKKYEEMRAKEEMKLKKKQEQREKFCNENPKKCPPTQPEKPVLDMHWTPKSDYVLYEPVFRYYDDFKENYLSYLNEKNKKAFLMKYEKAKLVEDEKLKKKKEKEEAKREKQEKEKEPDTVETVPVTPRTDYDLKEPGYRYVANTAENYEPYLSETSREPFMQKYEKMKVAENERLEKLEKRQKLNAISEEPEKEKNLYTGEIKRDYELSDPRYVYLYDTWMNYKDIIPERRRDFGENLLRKLSDKAAQNPHENDCTYAFKLRYPDQGDQLDDSASKKCKTEIERQAHIERLSTPTLRILEQSYELYKDFMSEEKAKKIEMTLARMRPISMEEMEAKIKQKNARQKKLSKCEKYRQKHQSEHQSKVEDLAYKRLVLNLLDETLRQLPPQILYSCQPLHLSNNQQKIYDTALSNFKKVPLISNTRHLHGLSMQVVKFFDKLLNERR